MNLRRALSLFAVAVPLVAQTPAPAQQGEQKRDEARVEQRAAQMREGLDAGRSVQSHVRVAVRLKNGNKLIGVVKDGRLVERVDGLRFVDAQAKDRGAGIRLWYTSGSRNYVFVPFSDLAEYEVLQKLSARQIDEIEREMQMDERRSAERAAEKADATKGAAEAPPGAIAAPPGAIAAPPAPSSETAPIDGAQAPQGLAPVAAPVPAGAATKVADKDAAKAPAATKEQEQQRQWFALLQAYPPAAGWNKKKRDEIAQRFVVLGVKPSEFELRFVDQFGEWEKACAHFAIDPAGKAATAQPDGTKSKGKGTRNQTGKSKEVAAEASEPAPGEGQGAEGSAESTESTSGKKSRKKN
ncbi:MAG: hypothetical protein ACK501_19060 [Planctomycetota bacterium]|jgi:hypothetical protein